MITYRNKIKEKGLKQKWVAKKLGVSQTMLSYYLNETRPIPDNLETELKILLK